MKQELKASLRMLIALTLLTGVIYPLFLTGVAQVAFHDEANGSLIRQGGKLRGSALVGQSFRSAEYFWSRPSATGYNPLPSGGSNLGPTSAALRAQLAERRAVLDSVHGDQPIPADLLYASGSGLDPHISPAAAVYQAGRVAAARGLDHRTVLTLIERHTEARTLGFLGEPRVNVLLLNLALDSLGR